MTVTLVTFGKTGERKDFTLQKKSTVIGRKTDADLRIPISEISRAHCEITMNGKAVELRDLGSSNGTFLNGDRVEEDTRLSPGDRIRVGSVVFVVQIDGNPSQITAAMIAPPAPEPQPAPRGAKASPDSVTSVGGSGKAAKEEEIEDIDIDALDDLDVDDLSDIDLTDEGSGDLDELEELSADDLIDDDGDETAK